MTAKERIHNPRNHVDFKIAQRNTKNHKKGQIIGKWHNKGRKNMQNETGIIICDGCGREIIPFNDGWFAVGSRHDYCRSCAVHLEGLMGKTAQDYFDEQDRRLRAVVKYGR